MTAADAERMAEVCAAEGVQLMEAFMYRLHPSWVAVRELVASGRIGRLTAVQSWFSYFNDDPANIRNIRDVGGGALYDVGCYNVNLSRMLFGAEPSHVSATITRDPVSGVDTTTSAILEFESGVATFTCSTRAETDQRVHVYGTDGRISIGIPFNIPPDRPTEIYVTAGGDPPVAPATETLTFATADPYTVEAERFAAAILDGTPVPVDAGGRRREPAGHRTDLRGRRGPLTRRVAPGVPARTLCFNSARRPGRAALATPLEDTVVPDSPAAPDAAAGRSAARRRGAAAG